MRWERLAFSDDLDDEGKRWYGLCPREIYRSILFLGDGQNILIFVGGAHATAAAGIVFKLAIEGRLKTGISGLLSRNPCFQTTLVTSRKVAWALPARNYVGQFCLGRGAKYPIFVGGAHATVDVCVLCKFIIKGRLKMRIASFSKTTISFSDDLLCIWIFNQTAKSAATQSQSRPATCFAAAAL